MLARLLVLVAAGLLFAGCGGEDEQGGDATTAAAATTTSAPARLEGASTVPVVVRGSSTRVALLTAVRAAAHDGFDRVVFQFRNAMPGYVVRYVRAPVRADGSGAPVAVKGRAVLLVRMEPALDADLSKESAPRTYTGPTRLRPPTSTVVELVRTGGFESVLSWAVGLGERRPFRVTALKNPSRLVIDVRTQTR